MIDYKAEIIRYRERYNSYKAIVSALSKSIKTLIDYEHYLVDNDIDYIDSPVVMEVKQVISINTKIFREYRIKMNKTGKQIKLFKMNDKRNDRVLANLQKKEKGVN